MLIHPYPEDIFWLIEYSDSSLIKDLETKSLICATAGIRCSCYAY